MVDATHRSFDASDRSYHSIIKKETHSLALNAGFSEKRIAELDIVVAELTSNLYKYADKGELLLGCLTHEEHNYIELISVDSGPGMNDLTKMMSDGFSSSNTIGHGLGSIKRLADHFDIFSSKGWGTIIVCRIYDSLIPVKKKVKKGFQLNALVVSKPGETTSGDGYYIKTTDKHIKWLLADGLGHGPEANFATNEAVKSFKNCPYDSPVEILRYIHPEVRKTRGLVATVVVLDIEQQTLRIAGIGNISTKLFSVDGVKSPLAYNGIVGHNIPNTMNDLHLDIKDFHQMVLCSDGMRSRWEISKIPGLTRCDLSIQAAAIYKDFSRRTDDMSVLVAKF